MGVLDRRVFRNKSYDMTVIAHTSPNDLGNFGHGVDYFYGFQSDDYDALWEEIRTTADPEARNPLLQDAKRYVAENAIHGFLFQLPRLGAFDQFVRDFSDCVLDHERVAGGSGGDGSGA